MKKLIILTIYFILIGSLNSFAEPEQEPNQKSKPEYTWEVGTDISHIKYEEPGIMKEEGIMHGIIGSYTYNCSHVVLKAEGRYSYGQVDYDGRLSDGTPYTVDNINDYMLELRGLVGYDFSILEVATLIPYIGLGYRYLNDNLACDPAGYERESNYFYSPIGIETVASLKNGWSIGVILEYDYFWKGIQKSALSDFNSNYSDLENDQDDGYGCRGSMRFEKKLNEVDLVIEPFIRYWNIARSDDATITYAGAVWGHGWEPENESTEYGIKIAAQF